MRTKKKFTPEKISLLKALLSDLRDETLSGECTREASAIVDCCYYLIEALEVHNG